MEKKDYLLVLKLVDSLPFQVGKQLLIALLQGDKNHESVVKHKLYNNPLFGVFELYDEGEVSQIIEEVVHENFLAYAPIPGRKWGKVLSLTLEGSNEMVSPTTPEKKVITTTITEQEEQLFREFDFFLQQYTREQKKAIVCSENNILCIAGAGSGKTTVLTKRIEFLIKFRGVVPSKILAITFTRKAKHEMEQRLSQASCGCHIETFNSFCEKTLRAHSTVIYGQNSRVLTFQDKIHLLYNALEQMQLSLKQIMQDYFTLQNMKGKTTEEMMYLFLADLFTIIDHCKIKAISFEELGKKMGAQQDMSRICTLCSIITQEMQTRKLRDFTDQLLDCIAFFSKNPSTIPSYEYILVDEYQDVNKPQQELISLLRAPRLFCVGDPRQAIFGWRGSDIRYILDFEKFCSPHETIILTANYRSQAKIVHLMNECVRVMKLPDLHAHKSDGDSNYLLKFSSEDEEAKFIVESILGSLHQQDDIFVLGRTHRQLEKISQHLSQRQIPHKIKTDDAAQEGQITLATVHAIKGLEAKQVYVMGATMFNYPCRVSDHPFVEHLHFDNYDPEEEERRLFYVAISRAKERLVVTYTGTPTRFITLAMKKHFKESSIVSKPVESPAEDVFVRLMILRDSLAAEKQIPPELLFEDQTLEDLAKKKPRQAHQLHEIYGLSPVKVKKYGESLLREIWRE